MPAAPTGCVAVAVPSPLKSTVIVPASLTVTSYVGAVTLVRPSPLTPLSLAGSRAMLTWPGATAPETTVTLCVLVTSGAVPSPSRTSCGVPEVVATVAAARNGLP